MASPAAPIFMYPSEVLNTPVGMLVGWLLPACLATSPLTSQRAAWKSSMKIWERFCQTLGTPEWITKPDYATNANRSKNRDVLNAEISEHTATRTSVDWVERFNTAGVPCGPIYAIDQVFADPQVKHLKMAHPLKHPKLGDQEVIGQAINMSRSTHDNWTATPEQGEHTEAVLKEVGYDAAAIEGFRQRGVI